MFDDGPAPFGKRMQVNSASIVFAPKGWFELPPDKEENREKRRIAYAQKVEKERVDFMRIHEEALGIKPFDPSETPLKSNLAANLKGEPIIKAKEVEAAFTPEDRK